MPLSGRFCWARSHMNEDEDFQYDRLLPQDLHVHEVKGSRYGDPVTEVDILEKIEGAIPKSTRKLLYGLRKHGRIGLNIVEAMQLIVYICHLIIFFWC